MEFILYVVNEPAPKSSRDLSANWWFSKLFRYNMRILMKIPVAAKKIIIRIISNNIIIIFIIWSLNVSPVVIFKDKIVHIFKWYFWFLSTLKFIHSLFSKLFAYNIQWISKIIVTIIIKNIQLLLNSQLYIIYILAW